MSLRQNMSCSEDTTILVVANQQHNDKLQNCNSIDAVEDVIDVDEEVCGELFGNLSHGIDDLGLSAQAKKYADT